MRKTFSLAFACALLVAAAAHASHYSDTYVIPIAGHTAGTNNTIWMSDVAIRNFGSNPLTVEMVFIESGFDTADNVFPLVSKDINGSVTVGPNSTVMLKDVLGGYMRENVTGALILGGNAPFAVTSRAYNNHSPLGQTVEPARDFLENSLGDADNNSVAYIPGIMSNAATRTNIGFVAGANGSMQNMVVEITVRSANGTSAATRTITIPSGSFAQMQLPLRSLTTATIDVGSVDFRIVEGEGVLVPYASLVDNNTGDATYIMGVLPEPSLLSTLAYRPNLFRALVDRTVSPGR